MNRPLIQIDDVIREMTEEEHARYLEIIANSPQLDSTNETPSPN